MCMFFVVCIMIGFAVAMPYTVTTHHSNKSAHKNASSEVILLFADCTGVTSLLTVDKVTCEESDVVECSFFGGTSVRCAQSVTDIAVSTLPAKFVKFDAFTFYHLN